MSYDKRMSKLAIEMAYETSVIKFPYSQARFNLQWTALLNVVNKGLVQERHKWRHK